MRILLSKTSKNELFNYLLIKNNCGSFKKLALILKIPFKTIQNWKYGAGYISSEFIPQEILSRLIILDKQEDNWGRIKGGESTYKIIIKKYGTKEILRRQSLGGKSSIKNLNKKIRSFNIDLKNKKFLEFYGALLGDGWLSRLKIKNKDNYLYLIGLSGHIELDKDYHFHLQDIIKSIFKRKGHIKERPQYNSRELLIGHRALVEFLNNSLNFPLGKKYGLKLHENLLNLGFDYTRYIIRGIFDTDGSFYLDKTSSGNNYPIISICMRQPFLINQIKEILLKEGFKPIIYHNGEEIKLKGSIQLKKWINEIGSSNKKHLDKINAFVAQPG